MSNELATEISIKVNIADRLYPLKVKLEEEEGIRKAAKIINEQLKEFQSNYAVKDKQDLLSMLAIKLTTENLELKSKDYIEDEDLTRMIDDIDIKLKSNLNSH
ncbi:MAG: cell division protein ZapA [Bacteroidia bacterium]|nr:cell division protein ZapA [Bacteroidia bacterium]